MNRAEATDTPPPARLRLTDFVDVETLQSLQDGFARLTGLFVSIRDAECRPITEPTGRSTLCELIHSTASGMTACRAADAEVVRLLRDATQPLRYECHAHLSQFVAPIIVQDQHVGLILLGRQPTKRLDRAALEALANDHGLSAADLAEAARSLVPQSDGEIATAAGFVQQLANTIARLCYQANELGHRVRELAALRDVSSTLAGRMGLQEILDSATRTLVATMGLRAAGLRLLDEDTGELQVASVAHVSMDYVDTDPILLSQSPIDQEVLETGHSVYVEDMGSDPRTYYKQRIRKEGLVSALVTPLASAGQRIGVLRAYMGHKHRFTSFDTSLLEAIASQVAAAIVNARLRRDALEAQKTERQLKLAGEVQRRMIPARVPRHRHCEFACVYEPSSELGGDFYDFLTLPDGDIGLVIADVVGKGVPASLVMASARSALRAHALRETDIAVLMAEVNQRLCHDTLPGEFVTALYAVLSADGRRLTYCNAGHEPLRLLRGGKVDVFDAGGLVLGIDPAARYETGTLDLEPGDLFVMATDGLIEALDYEDQEYGRERWHDSIVQHGAASPALAVDLIAKQLLWDMRRFVGLARRDDDVSLVVGRVR